MQPWVVPKALDRLKTILSTAGDVHADQVPLDVQSWERVMSNEFIHWGQEQIRFPKFDASQLESRPLQRSQLSRFRYIHAPVVYILYIQRFHGQKGVKMINMMECMRSAFASELLNRHIFGNSGGDSRDIIQTLLGWPSCAFPKA
jgi:glycogen synthase